MSVLPVRTSSAVRSAAVRTAPSRTLPPRTAAARPVAARPDATRLRLVHSAPIQRISDRTFWIFCGVLLVATMVMQLVLNTAAAASAFEKRNLQIALADLTAQQQALTASVSALESPDALLTKARRLGMVPASSPVFLRLTDHHILGKRVAAGGTQP